MGDASVASRTFSARLRTHVGRLAGDIGPRCADRPEALIQCAEYIEDALASYGYETTRYACEPAELPVWNIEAKRPAVEAPRPVTVVGAHYDTVPGSPGANDNTSGVAGLLTLAESLADDPIVNTVRFCAFPNEENPYFHTPLMGSYQYAKLCRDRKDRIRLMLCLETIGYYSKEANTQGYPLPLSWFYPSTADFVAFVGDLRNLSIVRACRDAFRACSDFPCQMLCAPAFFPGVAASDHWSFWKFGYPAVMITDTANLRYRHFHRPEDTPDKLEYESFAAVVQGVAGLLGQISHD
ncbi:MAG: M20/M25/M40 family metallo-hydrolase [Bryobacteraceae bacterium]